jgi:hypothetical protein
LVLLLNDMVVVLASIVLIGVLAPAASTAVISSTLTLTLALTATTSPTIALLLVTIIALMVVWALLTVVWTLLLVEKTLLREGVAHLLSEENCHLFRSEVGRLVWSNWDICYHWYEFYQFWLCIWVGFQGTGV